ncbi:hypothetical protein [Patulibacter minatonensis]|nr:hypothetical protein [Patulibacter minatonensis]
MTIEPHEPPPRDPEGEDGLPRGEWPVGSLIAIFAFVIVILLLFTQFG